MPLTATAAAAAAGKQMIVVMMLSTAAVGEIVAALAITQTNPETAVWSVAELKLYCFMGSLGGAVLKCWLLTLKDIEHATNQMVLKRMAGEFFASGICGLMFSPMIFRYMAWKPDVDTVLAVSAVVAFAGLALLVPVVDKIVEHVKAKKP